MAVVDKHISPFAAVSRTPIEFIVESVPINQAAVLFAAVIPYQGLESISAQGSAYVAEPAYAIAGWQVENVQANCLALAATAQVDVLIGAVSVLTGLLTPSQQNNNFPVMGSLAVPALRRGRFGDQLNMRVTTNGTGTFTGLHVTVTIRPFAVNDEAG